MSQILKLAHENQQLKRQINQYQQVLGVSPYVDDSLLKGGYRVVKTIADRDAIKCCWRKQGMKVLVIGNDLSFKEYVLKSSNCKENVWEEINLTVEENEVFLTEDYSELEENLTTQKELNLILKQLILNLQTSLNNKLHKGTYTGTAQDLKNDIDSKANISHTHDISSITNLQNSLDTINNDINNLEGIHYTWSPTNRTLTLFDNNGNQLSQVSLVSLDNEGTDIRYNASTLSLELYNADNELLDSIPVSSFIGSVGTQLQLNSNELQLKDSQGNILSTVSFAVSNIQGLQTALDNKLDKGTYTGTAQDLKNDVNGKLNKPTTTANTTTHPFVVGEDGNGNSARLPAGDLGKNFFNSDLSNTTARNHTMNAGVTINTLGNPHTLSGLPNENADIANFRKVRVQNTSGLDSVVDSKNLLTDGMTSMSDAEKDNWRLAQRKTGENYSLGQPRVDLILPFTIDRLKNYVQYVSIIGLNLFLNTSSPSVASVNLVRYKNINGDALPEEINVASNVEVNQINPSILTFGFNFLNFNEGYYKVVITHNGLTNLSSPDIIIKDNIVYTNNLPDNFQNNLVYADNYTTTNISVEKTYNTNARGFATVEQFSKIRIIPASAVLQGISYTFDVTLSGQVTSEPYNVIDRAVNEMGLSYDKDISVTGNLIDLSFKLGVGSTVMGKSMTIANTPIYKFRVYVDIYNGVAKMVVINLNDNTITTQTKIFQQLNQDLYFMIKSFGSGNISNIGQVNGTKINIILDDKYKAGI